MKQLLRLVAFAFGFAIASSVSYGQQAPNNPITAATQQCSDNSNRIVNTQFIHNCVGVIGGIVTSVNTGTGLTGGPIISTGTISIANIAGVAGSYTTPNLTVNGQGQITAISSSTVAGFPFTLGSTTINAGATVTTVTGLTLAGPTITGFLGGAPNFSGVPIFSGLSPGACTSNVYLDAGQHLVTGGCPLAGPGSSVANHVVIFADGSGHLAADSGILASAVVQTTRAISTSPPLSGGGSLSGDLTLSVTGPSNLTTFTSNVIPKGAGASAFVASSLTDNGTTVSTGEQIVSTLATGTAPFVVASTTNVANLNASSLGGATFAAPGAIGGTTPAAGSFSSLLDSAMAGTGVRCVQVDNTGLMSVAAGGCASSTGVTSVATTAPILGGTITTTGTISLTGPSNLTTFTLNVIPKGAATAAFASSSLTDNGTTVSTGEQIVSTLVTGTAPFSVASTTNVANLNASSLNGATFAAPGPIGSGTASTAAFTTLSATSTVSGAGITALFASPPAIGGTAPAAGAFTTLSATSTVNGAGITALFASPPAIGGTVAAAASFSSLLDTGMAGSGVKCVHVDNTGALSVAAGDCAAGGSGSVTSIATTAPISGGTITTTGTISITGPSNLTTFTTSAIPKGAGASAFVASSLVDNGTTVTTAEQIVSTLVTGTAPFSVASTTNVANLNASSLGGATFASPGPIGSTAASTGAFSTLSASTSITDTALAGSGTRCVRVDNTGLMGIAAGDCGVAGGTVQSIATTAPITGGTITVTGTIGITGPSNLTTFTANAIPKGATASPFVASSLVDNGTTVSTAEQIVSTLVTGTAPFVVASTTNVANLNASTLNGATHAAPGPIGSGTASTGAFTTLSASSTVSGTGFSTYLASPPAIGGTAAAAGSFTTLSASGQITSTVVTGTAPLVIASTTNVANLNASSLSGATFAAPGPIGSTTPSTGAFTTLSASSTVSGAGFTAFLASPPAIGGTAAAAGSFTTLAASSTVSGTGFSTYLASPPAIGSTVAGTGAFTTLSASSTVTLSGLASGTCLSGISIDASNHVVKIACPGGGGTVTSVGLGPGFTTTIGTQNTGSQTITSTGTINSQLWPTPKSAGSPYTLVAADTGNLIQANAGTFAFKFPNPAAGTKGTMYQLSDELGNGFTATTVGGTALLYGSPNTGAGVAVTTTLGVNGALQCVDDGTNYACLENPGLASTTVFGVVKPDNFSIFTTAGVLSAHDTVATGLTATGTTQATALQLTSTFNVVTSVAAGTGVALMTCGGSGVGAAQYVRNNGANDLLVYTKNGDSAVINNLGTTVGQVVPPLTTAFYKGTGTTQCYSIP